MVYCVKIENNDEIVLPANLRQRWQLSPGEELIVTEDEFGRHLTPRKQAFEAIQEELMAILPKGVSLVDELIAERRAEAALEG
jgi:bifunctional DNA-binding transcriptional regulator/antitoxin component of YhaV-PrlF toxin-antitoxin module